MQMNLEAIATDLDKLNKDHIRGANGLHQLNYILPDSKSAILGSVLWIWVYFNQFLSTSVSKLARTVDIYRPCVKSGRPSRTMTLLFCLSRQFPPNSTVSAKVKLLSCLSN